MKISFSKFLVEGVYDPSIFKAIFLVGGAGSGKSTVGSRTTGGLGFKILNADELFEYLMQKKGFGPTNKMNLDVLPEPEWVPERNKSKAATTRRFAIIDQSKEGHWEAGRLGLIIDATGDDYEKIKNQKKALEEMGYDCMMIFVNTSLEKSLERNLLRWRVVPQEIAMRIWHNVHDNMGRFMGLFGSDKFTIVDNTKDMEASDDKQSPKIWKQVSKFSTRPIENPIAKAWIAHELAKKKRR
jgi:predicted kinase